MKCSVLSAGTDIWLWNQLTVYINEFESLNNEHFSHIFSFNCRPNSDSTFKSTNTAISSSSIRQQEQRNTGKRSMNTMSPSSSTSPTTVSSSTVTPPPSFSADLSTASLHNQYQTLSRNGFVKLEIETQPEQQHRARYQVGSSCLWIFLSWN